MPGVTVQPPNDEAGWHEPSDHPRPDWRGWVALAWVLVWGWAYALMAIQARAPQVLGGIRTVSRLLGRLAGLEP